jgi:hypothetical protein
MLENLLAGGLHENVDPGLTVESSAAGTAWPAIIGGAFAAISLALLLLILGAGFGLASVSPWAHTGASATTVTVMTGVWLVVLHWLTSGLGGYLTGRLRVKWTGLHTHEVFFRDTANGFLSWAVASVAGTILVVSTTAFVVSGTAAVATSATTLVPSAYLLDRLFRTERVTTSDTIADDKAQAGRIILNALMAGEIPAPDKAYLAQLVSAQTGVTQGEAQQRVDQIIADTKSAENKVQQGADATRKAGATLAIFTGLAMLIGAFIACVAAVLGGLRRDIH